MVTRSCQHSIAELNVIANTFINNSIAVSTHRQYASCLSKYIYWCQQLNLVAFPLQQHNMILFASKLGTTSSVSNVNIHLAAVKFYALAHGYAVERMDRLYLVVRGIKKSHGNRYRKPLRIPVTPNMLKLIKFNMFNSSLRFEDKLMLCAAMVVAFFGLLRVSEYTCKYVKSFQPGDTLCYGDVTYGLDSMQIQLKTSKTDIFRSGVTIRLAANGSVLCPVTALKQYLTVHPSKRGPLFTYNNGRFLTRKDISEYLKQFAEIQTNLSSHSFRIGAATTLANMGHPRWLIQSLGRWSSDCFKDYLRISDAMIGLVSKAMVNQPKEMVVFDPDLL
jgi:hypothetical protein